MTTVIPVPEWILTVIRRFLADNKEYCAASDDDTTPRDQMLEIRALTPLIDALDPRWNGTDQTTIAARWYNAEWNSGFDAEEYRMRMLLLSGLVRFGSCRVTSSTDERAAYSVTEVSDKLLGILKKDLPVFNAMRGGELSDAEWDSICEYTTWIDCIDEYVSQEDDDLSHGISVAERWYDVLDPENTTFCLSEEERKERFEALYTILYGIGKTQRAKMRYLSR